MNPKDTNATVQLCVRLASDLRDHLHDAAVLAGVTVQALVISYVRAGLESTSARHGKPEPVTQVAEAVVLKAAALTTVVEQPSALTGETPGETPPPPLAVPETFVAVTHDTLPATSTEQFSTTGLDDIPAFILEALHLPCTSGPRCAAYPSCASYPRPASTPS